MREYVIESKRKRSRANVLCARQTDINTVSRFSFKERSKWSPCLPKDPALIKKKNKGKNGQNPVGVTCSPCLRFYEGFTIARAYVWALYSLSFSYSCRRLVCLASRASNTLFVLTIMLVKKERENERMLVVFCCRKNEKELNSCLFLAQSAGENDSVRYKWKKALSNASK